MPFANYNDLVSRIANGFYKSEPFWAEIQTATTATFIATSLISMQRCGDMKAMPSPLPSGVTAYIPTVVSGQNSAANLSLLTAKLINLGDLDISGASGTFTNGSAMPTITELGVSRTIWSAVLAQVTTALNATPGSIILNYVDQDGNAAEDSPSRALTASATVDSVAWVQLNTGDLGVQDLTTSTRRTGGTTPSGVIRFWGLVPISLMMNPTGNIPAMDNLITSGFNFVELGAGDAIGIFIFGATAVKAVVGSIYFVGDN